MNRIDKITARLDDLRCFYSREQLGTPSADKTRRDFRDDGYVPEVANFYGYAVNDMAYLLLQIKGLQPLQEALKQIAEIVLSPEPPMDSLICILDIVKAVLPEQVGEEA